MDRENAPSDSQQHRAREAIADGLIKQKSSARQRLLIALANPANLGKGVRDICEAANIHPDTYWDLKHDPQFIRERREAMAEALGDISDVLLELKRSATIPGRNGAQDRKTLLELAGRFPDKNVNVSGEVAIEHRLNATPLSQILWVYQRLKVPPERWLPAIRDQFEAGVLLPEMPPLKLISRQAEPIDGEMVHEEIVQDDRQSQEPRDDTPPD